MNKDRSRSLGIRSISVFFAFGAVVTFTAAISLLFPGSFLEPLWRLNPRARSGLSDIGAWAEILLCGVGAACAAAAVGLWQRARWGHHLAIVLFSINLIADIANVILGTEPRAAVGIPIVVVILIFLMSKGVRRRFGSPTRV